MFVGNNIRSNTYNIVTNGFELSGINPARSKFTTNGTFNCVKVNSGLNNVTIENMYFKGVGIKTIPSYLIYIDDNCSNITIRGCVFDGATCGVIVRPGCKNIYIIGCTFRNMVYVPGAGAGNSAVYMGVDGHLSIPESVVCIEDWAFAGFHTDTGFEFPCHIQELGFGIFTGAALNEHDRAADITVPEGVTKLLGTFFDALPMHSYTLPSTLAEIDAYTFVEAEPRPISNEDYYSGEYKKRAYQRYMVCYAVTPPAVIPSNDKSKVEKYYSSLEEDDILNSDDYRVGRFLLVPPLIPQHFSLTIFISS